MDCPSSSGNLCRPPIVSFSAPQSADLGDSVVFDASGSKSQNPNGTITTYAWVFASGADRFFIDTTSPLTTFTFRARSEEHTSELQSLAYLVCRLLLEKKKKI